MKSISKSTRVAGSRDVKFQAFLDGGVVTVKGWMGGHLTQDTYTFPLREYPDHPHDRKQFIDTLYRTFEQDPHLVAQASRHADAIVKAIDQLVS